MNRYASALGAGWLAIGLADAHSNGTYTIVSLLLVVLAGFLVSACVLLPQLYRPNRSGAILVGLGLLAVVATRPVERTWFFLGAAHRAVPSLTMLIAATVAAALWWLGRHRLAPFVAAIGFVVASVFVITVSKRPEIDVWYILQGATDGLWHGANMYTQHWTGSPGITDQFPYLPMTAVLLAPFRLAFGDVRYGLLAAIFVGAFLTSRLAPRGLRGGFAALLLLLPGLGLLVEGSWTEPLLFACLAGAVVATIRGRGRWALVALALALATKQHVWLLLPLFAAWPQFGWKRTAASTALGAALCLPWAVANPHAFWGDAFSYNLHLAPRWDSLDLYSFALRMGWTPPFWLVGLMTLMAIALALRIAKTPSGLLAGSSFVLLVFDIANKQSFFNEWWLVGSLLLAAIASAAPTGQPAGAFDDVGDVRLASLAAS